MPQAGHFSSPPTEVTARAPGLKPNIIDIIPNIASAESEQNSEPSLAVDPFDPGQMIAGAFGSGTPYFKTVNSGTT